MADNNTILLFVDTMQASCEMLDDAQLGQLLRAIVAYSQGDYIGDEITDIAVKVSFAHVKVTLDASRAKYNEICEKRKIAGRKGAQAKQANASKCQQMPNAQAKQANAGYNNNKNNNKNNNDVIVCNNNNKEIVADACAKLRDKIYRSQILLQNTASSLNVDIAKLLEFAEESLNEWQVCEIAQNEITMEHLLASIRVKANVYNRGAKERAQGDKIDAWRNSLINGAKCDMAQIMMK